MQRIRHLRIITGIIGTEYIRGWTVYNILNTEKIRMDMFILLLNRRRDFLSLYFGSYKDAEAIDNYKAGDIMSSSCRCCGHVWIVVGPCGDGSVVLLHSSPAGVQMNGTVTPTGKRQSGRKACKKIYEKILSFMVSEISIG